MQLALHGLVLIIVSKIIFAQAQSQIRTDDEEVDEHDDDFDSTKDINRNACANATAINRYFNVNKLFETHAT